MNTKRILISMVTGALMTGSLMAASGNDQVRTKTKVRTTKPTATATTTTATGGGGARVYRTRTRNLGTTGGNTIVRSRTVTTQPVYTTGTRYSYSYPYRTYGYSSYGYPYYGYNYGPSVSIGFGSPYYGYGYGYPYSYGYGYPYSYNYGSYYYNQPGYAYGNGSIVVAVQARLARSGYYRGPIDGVMGPGTRSAIAAYEQRHGLRIDGVISGPLLRNMGLRA